MLSRCSLPLALVSFIIFLGGFVVAWEECRNTGGPEGNLQSFCRQRAARCLASERPSRDCHEALLDLELIENRVVVWRVEWAFAVVVATVTAVTTLAAGVSFSLAALLFLVTFLACMFGLKCMHSYKQAHILNHPKDARAVALRMLLGAPESTSHAYY